MIRILSLLLLVSVSALGQASKPTVQLDTMADLMLRNTVSGERVSVAGLTTAGDWGAPRIWRHNPASTAATNVGCVYESSVAGRYEAEDCNTGEIDARWWGAKPYRSVLMTPWAYQTNIAAIGTNDFSVWARLTIPSTYTQPGGWFTIGSVRSNTNTLANPIGSTFSFRSLPGGFGFLSRGTTGSSSPGSTVDDAALLNTNSPAAFSAYFGQEVDFVFTRSGTNVVAYINGTNVNSLMHNENTEGWAKSVGGGLPLLLQIGGQENGWYWSKPITRFALWTSALSAGDAADPENAGSKVVDYTPTDSDEPSDSGPAIQAAIDWAESVGGANVILPAGKYRISTGIRMGYRVSLKGAGSPFYPSPQASGAIFASGGTMLVPWFGDSLDVVSVLRSDMDANSVMLSLRNISTLSSVSFSLNAFVNISDLCIYGEFARDCRGIFLDRVGSVAIDRVGFYNLPGHNIYGTLNNGAVIRDCSGTGGRGVALRGAADNKLHGNFLDAGFGPALWLAGNLNIVSGNVFEVARDPSYGASPWKDTVTANAGTDTITVTLAQGNRFRQGDVVRFTTTGTLPSPLTSTNDYYVGSVTTNSFKVFEKYADDVLGTGAMLSSGAVDIADAGTGTHSVVPGPAVGILIAGDNNQIGNNISHLNYESGLQLEYGRWNSVSGNSFIMNGVGNSANWTTVAGIRLLYESGQNRITGNGLDNRGSVDYTPHAIITDSTSVQNSFIGNSYSASNRLDVAANNYIADGQYQITRNNGSLYIPSTDGFGAFDAQESQTPNGGTVETTASAIHFDYTSRRIYLSTSSGSTNGWYYSPAASWDVPQYWSFGGNNNTLQAINNTTNSYPWLFYYGAYNPTIIYSRISSTNAAEGPRWVMTRNANENNSAYIPLRASDQLGEVLFSGITDTNGNEKVGASISATAWRDWSTTNSGGYLSFNVTPTGSTTRSVQVYVLDEGRLMFVGRTSDPTNSVLDGQIYYNSNTGKFRGRAAGSWVDLH